MRRRLAITAAAIAVASIALCVLAPLREISGDTVPGRIGGAVLRCGGGFDLSRVDWIRAETDHQRMFYFMQRDDRLEFSSIFGPAPAVIGALALLDFGPGDEIDDATLRHRERDAAAVLIAIAAALLTIAAAARTGLVRAAWCGAVATLSFAGAASLGQGLWQASVALPPLVGALTVLAWRERRPRLAIVAPALLVVAVMVRPTVAPLALGLGAWWAHDARGWRPWLSAIGIAVLAAAPLAVWNVPRLWSVFPIGQWGGNTRTTDHVFTISQIGDGVAGLIASPARGLVWFAPVVLVGLIQAARRGSLATRLVAGGIVLELLVMAAFFKWHGGMAYGPRLLAEATWLGIWLAFVAAPTSRGVLAVACAVTIVVGQLGLWGFHPEQWERRRNPDVHHEALWDFVDSPIPATLHGYADQPIAHDAPPTRGLVCEHGDLRSLH